MWEKRFTQGIRNLGAETSLEQGSNPIATSFIASNS